jgi:hypothetical protein
MKTKMLMLYTGQKYTTYFRQNMTWMQCSSFKFTFALNSVLFFRKLFVFEFLLGMFGSFLCSVSALRADVVLLLDALQLFVEMLTYLVPKILLKLT